MGSVRIGLAVALALLGCLPSPGTAAPLSGPAHALPAGATRVLSVPGRLSRWAFVTRAAGIQGQPGAGRASQGTLSLTTSDGTNELVELLAERRVDREMWVEVRTSLWPSPGRGWVPLSALSKFHHVNTWLIVDKRSLEATLIAHGAVVFRAPVGIGKPSTPTPEGSFYIRDRLSGFAPGSLYGPLAFGTSAHSHVLSDWPGGAVVGIHGTNQPGLIPGRISHGCIRMRNSDILRLGRLVGAGTPVTVR